MKKLNTSPISGMQELLPARQVLFNKYKREIEEVYHRHGFLSIETPVIDRAEILFAKAGGETEKQIYKVVKTEESADSADQALRFDHTVPLARYVAEHESDLSFPFKVTQIGRNFRGERAQKGRFREFYQCDIDVIGRGELSLAYDAEVIATLFEAVCGLGLKALVRISNRKILSGLLEALNLNHLTKEILSIIDHAEKVPEDVTAQKLADLGIGEEYVVKITTFMNIAGGMEVLEKLVEFGVENETFAKGLEELSEVCKDLSEQGLSDNLRIDMKIVRGLDYYTGTVFETIIPDYKQIGSVCSGGRYDNLASLYTDQLLPGVGGSIGLTRLFFAMSEFGLAKTDTQAPLDVAVVPIDKLQNSYAQRIALKLRKNNKLVDVVLTDKKLGDKLKYASKVAKYGVVIGDDEVRTGELLAKNFETGEKIRLADL
ncbi:histidine--tRNA ligase [Candidatus Saccharibacteria bacterium]|nr:histidine--tRNA ligase [Candidatus Saccharibacteria bacterium]